MPDITGVKGEDIASFLADTPTGSSTSTPLGADKLVPQYLAWKLKQATTKDGKLIGFPIDIGPCATFYREDLFAKAGLPTDPARVSAELATWDDYFKAGVELHEGGPEDLPDQQHRLGVLDDDRPGHPAVHRRGQQVHRRPGPHPHRLDHRRQALHPRHRRQDRTTTPANAAISNGSLGTEIGAAWHALDIEQRGPGHQGQLAGGEPAGRAVQPRRLLPGDPRDSGNPEEAFKIITWLLSPENQARGFTDAALFPTAPAATSCPR